MAAPTAGAPDVSRATNFVAPDLAKKTKGAYNELYAEHPALVTFANGDIGVVTGVCGSPKAKGGLQLEVAPRNDVTSSPIKKLNVSELEGKGAGLVKSVVVGFGGGIFEDRGLFVKVSTLSRNSRGKAVVNFHILDADGTPLNEERLNVNEFLEKYPPIGERPRPPLPRLELKKFPKLLAILHGAGVIGDGKSTSMVAIDGHEWLSNLAESEITNEEQALDAAATLELKCKSPDAAPQLAKIRAAMPTHALSKAFIRVTANAIRLAAIKFKIPKKRAAPSSGNGDETSPPTSGMQFGLGGQESADAEELAGGAASSAVIGEVTGDDDAHETGKQPKAKKKKKKAAAIIATIDVNDAEVEEASPERAGGSADTPSHPLAAPASAAGAVSGRSAGAQSTARKKQKNVSEVDKPSTSSKTGNAGNRKKRATFFPAESESDGSGDDAGALGGASSQPRGSEKCQAGAKSKRVEIESEDSSSTSSSESEVPPTRSRKKSKKAAPAPARVNKKKAVQEPNSDSDGDVPDLVSPEASSDEGVLSLDELRSAFKAQAAVDKKRAREKKEAQAKAARRAAGTAPKSFAEEIFGKSSDDDENENEDTGLGPSPAASFGRLTPPDMTPLEVASIIFGSIIIRKLVGVQPMPTHVHANQQPKMLRRFVLALDRLNDAIGSGWMGTRPPRTVSELEERVEVAAHRASKKLPPGWASQPEINLASPERIVKPRHTTDEGAGGYDVEDGNASNKKPSEGLPQEKRLWAVSTDVASNLHMHKEAVSLAVAKHEHVADIIRDAPATFRADLQRVVSSNGLVEAQGEFAINRRTLPADAQRLRRKTEDEVQKALSDIPRHDITRESSLDPSVVASLASATVEGSVNLADFAKAAKGMLGSKASPEGSYQALVEAWSLMETAFKTALAAANLRGS